MNQETDRQTDKPDREIFKQTDRQKDKKDRQAFT